MIKTKLDINKMTRYLEQVTKIAEDTEDADCRMVCRLFKEVCSDIADGAEIDKFTMNVVEKTKRIRNEKL